MEGSTSTSHSDPAADAQRPADLIKPTNARAAPLPQISGGPRASFASDASDASPADDAQSPTSPANFVDWSATNAAAVVSGGVDDCFPAADCSPRTFPRPDVVSPPSSPSIPSDHTSATHTYRAHSSV